MADARRRLRALEDFCTQVETGMEALPEYFRLLRSYVDSEHAAYFCSDEHGRMFGAFHEISQNTPHASEFIRRARTGTDARSGDLPSVAELFRMPVPVQLLRFDTVAAEESALYRDVIRPVGGRHVLRVGLRIGRRPAGLIALVRGSTSRSFTEADRQRLLRATRPLKRVVARASSDDERVLVGEGFLIVASDGRPLHGSSDGWRLWELIQDRRFLPVVDPTVTVVALLASGGPQEERSSTLRTGGGDFDLIAVPLRPEGRGRVEPGCLLRIRHRVLARIVFARRMDDMALSPMQKLVCLDLLEGKSQSDIALDHGIGVQTVITHIRGIYAKAGVSSRGELIEKLRAA